MPKAGKGSATDQEARVELPVERSITMPSRDYQPTKAELEEEFDMPGADIKTVRSAFFRPIRVATK